MFDKILTLSNGVIIPQLALGTWLIDDGVVSETVKSALKIGYRHIDTAQDYGNERGVGQGIRESGIPRNEIFVTSKVLAELKDYDSAYRSIEESLNKLDIGYIDLMLIHCPVPWALYNKTEERFFEGNLEAWKALEHFYDIGMIRAIGVSNFLKQDIENIWNNGTVKPMVNQVQCNVLSTPIELIDYCQNKGIVMEAYSPIAHGRALENEDIAKMAEKYGVTIAQLCIRYDVQLGMVVLPKTVSPERMLNNADLDFVISNEDMEYLKNLNK